MVLFEQIGALNDEAIYRSKNKGKQMPTKDRRVSSQKANKATWKLLKGSLRQRLSATLLAPLASNHDDGMIT
jgi:hypothetical protein